MAERKRKKTNSKARYTFMRVLNKTDRFLKKGADIVQTVGKVGKDPRPTTILHAGMQLTQQAINSGFFDNLRVNRWPKYYPGLAHHECLFQLLDTFPRKTYGDSNGNEIVKFYDFYGKTVAMQKEGTFLRYLAEETSPEELRDLFARTVWEQVGSPCMMIASSDANKTVTFEYSPSPDKPIYASEMCTEVMARLKPFIEAEVGRSAMFTGPPGTGKSCMVDAISAAFGHRVLNIDVSNLSFCNSAALTNYITRLQPDVLVINDLDRFCGADQMLTSIEELNKTLKLLLVTVNNKNRLPKAVLRPGRFDEMILVDSLDANVALKLIEIPRNEISDALFEELVTWPAAFIAELGKRLKYLGKDKLVEEFASLQVRVEENRPKKKEE